MSVPTHLVAAVCRAVKDLNEPGGSDSQAISESVIALLKETKYEKYRLTPAGMAKLDTDRIDRKKDTTTIIDARCCAKKRRQRYTKRKRPCSRRRRRRLSRRKRSCSRKRRTSRIRPRRSRLLIKMVRPKRPKLPDLWTR